jgi:hypothetical protein
MSDSAVLRPAPSASGTLAKTPLVHLLVYIHDRKLTGTIELATTDKRATAAIRFMAGEPAKVRTSAPGLSLGTVLRDLGFLTDAQLEDSLRKLQKAKAAGRALHGQLLVDDRIVDRRKLESGLREQVARKLRAVAAMPPETMYGFYDGFDGLRGWGGDLEQGFDPIPMLWPLLADSPPVDHVASGLARIGLAPLRLVKDADIARFALDDAGGRLVELLRGRPLGVSGLVTESGLPRGQVELLAYLLLVTKRVEVLRGQEPPLSTPPAPGSAEHAPVSRAPVPAVERSSKPSFPRIKSASASGRMAAVPPPPPPPSLPAELAARWQEITDRASSIDRTDYFTMLDLARDATREEIETTFFALAKRWHPDRLPTELAPVRDPCSRVFGRMSEAHATLADEDKRKRYMNLLADGSGSPETQETVAKVLEAATDFQKAEVCFKRNDLAQAELWCRKATEGDPTQPNYRALLAWIIALKPENHSPEKTLEGIKALDDALAVNEKAEAAHVWRGMLYKRIGKEDLALLDFARAAELNPRNIDAAREVRLSQMRGGGRSMAPGRPGGGSKPEEAGKGLLGRLFKK